MEEGGETKSTVTLDLERKHLGSVLLCKILHEALDEELAAELQIDINLPVESVELDDSSLEGEEWANKIFPNRRFMILSKAS